MNDFLHGAITLASAAVGLFFLRYWRSTRDRLFLFFSAAFWLMSAQWLLVSIQPRLITVAHSLRFLAFILIALGVLDKNRQREERR